MNASKERLHTALAHREPDRPPMMMSASPRVIERLKQHVGVATYRELHRALHRALHLDICDLRGFDYKGGVGPRFVGPEELGIPPDWQGNLFDVFNYHEPITENEYGKAYSMGPRDSAAGHRRRCSSRGPTGHPGTGRRRRVPSNMKTQSALFVAMGMWAASASAMNFVHPGALNSKAELDFVKAKIQAGAQPWKGEFDQIISSSYATRGPHGLANINSGNNDANVSRDDAIASYTQALLWYFTGDETYAKRSIAILNCGLQLTLAGTYLTVITTCDLAEL